MVSAFSMSVNEASRSPRVSARELRRRGCVDRCRASGTTEFQGVENIGWIDISACGDLGDGGGAPQLLSQRVRASIFPAVPAHVAHSHRPRGVAEVSSDGAQDRGNGVCGEGRTTFGVELVDGLDQSDGRDLRDVLNGSPRSAYRRARWWTSGMCVSMSSSRTANRSASEASAS